MKCKKYKEDAKKTVFKACFPYHKRKEFMQMLKKFRILLLSVGIFVLLFSVPVSAAHPEIPVSIGVGKLNGYLIQEKTMIPLFDFCKIMDGTSRITSFSGGVLSIQTKVGLIRHRIIVKSSKSTIFINL